MQFFEFLHKYMNDSHQITLESHNNEILLYTNTKITLYRIIRVIML